jgi:hypothetical protein
MDVEEEAWIRGFETYLLSNLRTLNPLRNAPSIK